MCGICGIYDLKRQNRIEQPVIEAMTGTLRHRGPDDTGYYSNKHIAFGFTRLSIIDLDGGMQPLFNEDRSLVLICNGEIFNYIELRRELIAKGHTFTTNTDVEVLLHLYEDKGTEFLNELNGQFAFALFDFKKQCLFCARDHFGIIPFFYTAADGLFIFASEIKALLEHPRVKRNVDPAGLDQVFSFPGLISPRTMFRDIKSLKNGHYLSVAEPAGIKDVEYWDLVYPEAGACTYHDNEDTYAEKVRELISRSVELRLRSDVPVGCYISGGLDSSLVMALTRRLTPQVSRNSFGISFKEKEIDEAKYQRIMSQYVDSLHHDILFDFSDISRRLQRAVNHSECPVKETYNTASLALSERVRAQHIKVILTGEGADEFFAGYVGYRFDKIRQMNPREETAATPFEKQVRLRLWGDEDYFYEKDQYAFAKVKKGLYSAALNENYGEVDCLDHFVVNKERLKNRDDVHKRSYIDYKLRLADHLISDHGDRMAMANSVEARYPFLDRELLEYVTTIPPHLKLKDFQEKYILKKACRGVLPDEIIDREKFGFVAPGSPYLLKRNIEYIDDSLSYETIKKQGYFNPETVERLKKEYTREGFRINVPFDSDLLIIVLTFGIFMQQFKMNNYS